MNAGCAEPAGRPDRPVTVVSREAESAFAARLTAIADAECEALCQTIMGKALDGERWAVELVVRYVYARHDDGQDALRALLEEIRDLTTHGA